jgi:hypothetical protein
VTEPIRYRPSWRQYPGWLLLGEGYFNRFRAMTTRWIWLVPS